MSETELVWLSLWEAVNLIGSKAISPVELTRAYLHQIERLDGRLNTFITVTADLALEQARVAEDEQMNGETRHGHPLSRLHGVPIAMKDLFETAGVRTTAGSLVYKDHFPEKDCTVYSRLREDGCILLGKTNMHEIALGLTSVNPHYGAVHNPWKNSYVAGGSSGGSAAALAAGMCSASLGTDTGGSIRVPAALCGVSGLKPTYGRVSTQGVIPLSWNLDHVGPMARDARDLALLMDVIAGYDSEDPGSANISAANYCDGIEAGVRNIRIGIADDEYFHLTDPEISNFVNRAAQVFADLGAIIEKTPFPGANHAALSNSLMIIADAAFLYRDPLENHPENFGEDVRQRLTRGAGLELNNYIEARRSQVILTRQFEEFFHKFDLFFTPTTAITAPPISGPNAVEMAGLLTRFTAPFNFTRLPAISIPCGITSEGLPVGLQIIAPPWQEMRLLQAACAFQSVTEWHLARPDLPIG